MAGGDRIELLLPRFDGLEGMDAAARGIHLRARGPVARTGGQAEAAVHAGVCGDWNRLHRPSLTVFRQWPAKITALSTLPCAFLASPRTTTTVRLHC